MIAAITKICVKLVMQTMVVTMLKVCIVLIALIAPHAQARDLEHGETTAITAEVHVAAYNGIHSVFLTVANDYHNTVSCSGKVMVITNDRDKIGTDTLSFNNLRVYPRNAFPYRITYPIANHTLNYADTDYAPINIKCKGWDFLVTLPAALCRIDPDAHYQKLHR